MSECLLDDRAILAVSGEDAETLLNRLFTNSMLAMAQGTARYAALLSPQGKLEYDFLVVKRDDGFWIDCVGEQAQALARKLTMFRLRSKAPIATRAMMDSATGSLLKMRRWRPSGRMAPPTKRIGSRSACRKAASISCMAIRSCTTPISTFCTASISTRAATSARRSCPASIIASRRASAS